MKALKNFIDKIRPTFSEGGKLAALHSLFDGLETFLFVPSKTSKRGVHVHDSTDSKRTMTVVVLALMPALFFGMYNIGYQHYLALGQTVAWGGAFLFGLLAMIPKIVVSYLSVLGVEFTIAQIKKHEVAEGALVTGMLIPLIVPVDTPLWMIAVAAVIAVIFAKEVFGGTGYNIFNVALVTRAILFFGYPLAMSGDKVFVRTSDTFGIGGGTVVDAYSGATPLGQAALSEGVPQIHNIVGEPISTIDYVVGLIPGSIGETSIIAILIGAVMLLVTGIASWKIMCSVFVGGYLTALGFNAIGANGVMLLPALDHVMLGGFAFGAVFMATDPVTAARTEKGKYIYGFLIGVFAILIRVLNPGYPEGMMLAILLMNFFAPLIDFYVVDANVRMRAKRAIKALERR